jgi:hypothetical protein
MISSSPVSQPLALHSVGVPDTSLPGCHWSHRMLTYGPVYHVHEKAVPSDGNCTGTGAHLDPAKVTEAQQCGALQAAGKECQVGDLSGKFGNITAGPTFSKT